MDRGRGGDRGRGMGGRGGPQKRGAGPPGLGGPPKRPRYDAPPAPPANGYVSQAPAPGYGAAGNGYAAPAPPAPGYGASYAQQGYAQSYQGYENYQQPPEYAQTVSFFFFFFVFFTHIDCEFYAKMNFHDLFFS